MPDETASPWLPSDGTADAQFVQTAVAPLRRRRRLSRRTAALTIVAVLLLTGSGVAIVLLAIGATGSA